MPAHQPVQSSGDQSKPAARAEKPEINLQDLAERILNLMKKEARIEQERLGKKSRSNLRR
jgi:hypothetical protein